MRDLEIHPAANLFPMMNATEFKQLLADIKEHGVQTTLKLLGETLETAVLIDGRNRLKAMKQLNIDPMDYADLIHPDDLPDPVGYVLSLNLHRRHLDESQRAMVANKVAKLKHGQRSDTAIAVSASQQEAASTLNVSVDSVQRARKVAENGVPDLAEAVERGEVSVSAAATVATMPKEEQQKLVDQGPAAVKEAASKKRRCPPVKEKEPRTAITELEKEVRAYFDSIDRPDELAIRNFIRLLRDKPLDAIEGVFRLWMEWSGPKERSVEPGS